MRKRTLVDAMAIAFMLTPAAAMSNGYLFFHDHQLDAKGGTVYLGAVTDTTGKPMANAQVTITILQFKQALVIETDARGRYRSDAIAKTIQPGQVQVAVIVRGYRTAKTINMSRGAAAGAPIETNFILAPVHK